VIDFIDMTSRKHQREVEECLRSAMQIDKARVQIGRISRFGLLEMSRQRLRPSLGESSQETCPRCTGHGTIRSVESLALSIMRLVEEEVMKEFTGQIIVQAPTEVINFLHNEKRTALAEVESRHKVPIVMLANQHLVTPHFEILRVRKSDISDAPSYSRIDLPEAQVVANERTQTNAIAPPGPAVKRIVRDRPAPMRTEEKEPGLFARLANMLFSHPEKEPKSTPAQRKKSTAKTGNKPASQQNRQKQTQSSRQQSNRRNNNKRTGQAAQKGGNATRARQPQRQTKKQSSKKQPSKQGQAKQTQAQQTQSKQTQGQADKGQTRRGNRGRPPKAKQDVAEATSAATAESNVQTAVVAPAVASDVNGNVKPEKKESTSRRGGRRRRSPYKTGGAKPRPEQTESQAQTTEAGNSPEQAASDKKPMTEDKARKTVADKTPEQAQPASDAGKPDIARNVTDKPAAQDTASPVAASTSTATPATTPKADKPAKPRTRKAKPADIAAEAVQSKSESSESKVAEKTATPDVVKSTDSKPKTSNKAASKKTPSAAKAAKGGDESPKPKKRPARKKAASKKETKKTSAKPAANNKPTAAPQSPVIAAEQDSKGIYTLKPPPSEHTSGE
jgi:ribonuclease E